MSIFADDWRACLREHYMYVVRTGDRVTLPSLTQVMYEVGFTDDELAELRLLATMRADDMPADYAPPKVAAPPKDAPPAPELDAESRADEPDAPRQLSLF